MISKDLKVAFEKALKKQLLKRASQSEPICSLARPPSPELSEGSALQEAFLVADPFVGAPEANQSAAPLARRLQFPAFRALPADLLILLRGVYIQLRGRPPI